MTLFYVLLTISTVSDALLAAAALGLAVRLRGLRAGSLRLDALSVLAAVAMMAVIFVAKVIAFRPLGLNGFGVMHMIYLDLGVVIPLLSAGLLVVRRRGLPWLGKTHVSGVVVVAAGVALLGAPLAAYATFVEPYRLRVERTTVPFDSAADSVNSVTIAILADLQFRVVTDYERNAIRRTMELQPDIIVLPGDVFQGPHADFQKHLDDIRELLGMLWAPGGVYLVDGDTDTPERLRQAVAGTEVVFLYNELARAHVAGHNVVIGGIECDYRAPAAQATINNLRVAASEDNLSLLLTHRPCVALKLAIPSGIDMVLAGHTHGGQVQVPGVGPLLTASLIPRAAAAGGVSVLHGTSLYVSRGVGCERGQAPLVRFLCPPEVSLLTFVPRHADAG